MKTEPGVISGALSASVLAKGEDSEEAFDIKEVPLLHFFPNQPQGQKDDETSLTAILREANLKDVAKYTMTVQRLALNENQYRNSVYRQLTAADKYHLETVKGTSKGKTYHELDLIKLFEAFVEANEGRISTEESKEIIDQLNREEHGLRVTTTSKPDLSFIRLIPGFGKQFVLGELKHASNFTKRIAEQQAALYLQGFLFFLRVKLGLPVKTIYGFALCGAKCSGFESKTLDPKYAVGLIKITAPDSLEGEFVVESHWEHFGAFDSSGLKLLIHFLKCGNSYEFYQTPEQQQAAPNASVWALRRPPLMRCPSLFTIPPSLWDDTNERQLVVNGTLAAVFRVFSIDAAKQLLDNIVLKDESNIVQQDKGRVCSDRLDQLQFESYIYVKIHTTETIKKLKTATFQGIWKSLSGRNHSAISDFLQTYPVEPPILTKCSFIVMRNRGNPLLAVDLATIYTNFSGVKPFLSSLKAEVGELGRYCFHGDMLPHNVAVSATTRKLTLVDYDEARENVDKTVPRRLIPVKSNVERRLSYPNVLRKDQKTQYSIIQFSLIVRFVAETLSCSDSQQKLLGNLTSCHERLADLVDIDDTKGTISQETVNAILMQVKDLVNHVDALLLDGSGEEKMEATVSLSS